jgi:hypothetical protein
MVYDVLVDFTDTDNDGHVLALTKHACRTVNVGEVVVVSDGEDAFAKAVVAAVTPSGWIDLQIQRPGTMPTCVAPFRR